MSRGGSREKAMGGVANRSRSCWLFNARKFMKTSLYTCLGGDHPHHPWVPSGSTPGAVFLSTVNTWPHRHYMGVHPLKANEGNLSPFPVAPSSCLLSLLYFVLSFPDRLGCLRIVVSFPSCARAQSCSRERCWSILSTNLCAKTYTGL